MDIQADQAVAVCDASPVWMPIRTWTCSPAGQA